jgi:hypothetical protein
MKKLVVQLFCCVGLLAALIALMPEKANAQLPQRVLVTPTETYRFTISFSDGGYMLTGSWQEGQAWGYTPDLLPVRGSRNGNLGIYLPPFPGYTPDAGEGLVPLHRWRVIQNGWRNYFYYSIYYGVLGGDYHYEGIQGYVFPPGQATFRGAPLSQVSSWYSQSKGYWNGGGTIPEDVCCFPEQPPDSSFVYQGKVCAMPFGPASTRFPDPNLQKPTFWDVGFNAPPPPPPPGACNVPMFIKTKCVQQGGWWDEELCECVY